MSSIRARLIHLSPTAQATNPCAITAPILLALAIMLLQTRAEDEKLARAAGGSRA